MYVCILFVYVYAYVYVYVHVYVHRYVHVYVYAVEVDVDDGRSTPRKLADGVANIGIRPTFEKRGVLCEAHLFDSDYDLYGQRLLVRLKAFLRSEKRFAGIDELLAQIAADAEHARYILSELTLCRSG